jgi:putative heme-binding domain-containing protein
MQTAPGRLQLRFGQTLAGNAAGAEALLTASEAGQLPPQLLADRSLKQKLLAAAPANAEARVTRLTRNLPAANAEVQRLIDQRKASFESGRFVAASGEPVFTKNCRVCHQIDGTGSLVGPQLDGVGGRGLERLLEDMLDPNRNVDPAFHTINVVLHDGDVVSGLFRREEGEAIVLADSTGKEISIPKKDIKERRASTTSLMPENFGEIVTGEDFNNLMAFLLAHGPKAAAGK